MYIRREENYIPSLPRLIAAIPVRDTSESPTAVMRLMKRSISSVAPVSSNTNEESVASSVRAPKAPASRSASTRGSPVPATTGSRR